MSELFTTGQGARHARAPRTPDSEAETPRAAVRRKPSVSPPTEVKFVNLALQGGGAHGAFAWGVLDRLLEKGSLGFEGITATSAGAMNATVLAYGLHEGGPDGAREALANFWRRIAHVASLGPLQPSLMDRLLHNHELTYTPAFVMLDLMSRLFSPYQLNPTNYNPLRGILEEVVDFGRLRDCRAVRLFLSATNVRTGKVRIFRNQDITPDAVMASACLPLMFQAVEIDGEAYWDGGYMGNPALYPLIYHCESRDVVIVHINPLCRPEIPTSAHEIMSRINEISFNSSLMREMRAIHFVTKLIDEGKLVENGMKKMLIHSIAADDVMQGLNATSKLNADWEFLTHLRDLGRERADEWLESTFERLNRETTIDFETYL
ncbi:MAG TPA: patatin-like phospholipase family protein [Gammaproteobacteria bacterium]|nr:patatin-like phospholipase family protein [Gammaproteobacteria bacterium]